MDQTLTRTEFTGSAWPLKAPKALNWCISINLIVIIGFHAYLLTYQWLERVAPTIEAALTILFSVTVVSTFIICPILALTLLTVSWPLFTFRRSALYFSMIVVLLWCEYRTMYIPD